MQTRSQFSDTSAASGLLRKLSLCVSLIWCAGCASSQTVILDVRNIQEPVMLNDVAYAVTPMATVRERGFLGSVGMRDEYNLAFYMVDVVLNSIFPFGPNETKASLLAYYCSAEAMLFEQIGHYDSRAVLGGRIRADGDVWAFWPFGSMKRTTLTLTGTVVESDSASSVSQTSQSTEAAEFLSEVSQ